MQIELLFIMGYGLYRVPFFERRIIMAYDKYTNYALIKEDNQNTYINQEVQVRKKLKEGELKNISISEAIFYFTGISLSLIEKSIEQFGVTDLAKHIYSLKITSSKRKKLELLFSIYNKMYSVEATDSLNVNSPDKIAKFLYSKIGSSQNEKFYVIYLNTRCDVLGSELMFVGGSNQCLVDVNYLFKKALINSATNLIIGHNHRRKGMLTA